MAADRRSQLLFAAALGSPGAREHFERAVELEYRRKVPMIPIRVESASPITTFGVRQPMSPDHPMADIPCPVCDGPLTAEPITLVLVGIDPETRAEGKAWCTGAAVVVHAACAGLDPGLTAEDQSKGSHDGTDH